MFQMHILLPKLLLSTFKVKQGRVKISYEQINDINLQ